MANIQESKLIRQADFLFRSARDAIGDVAVHYFNAFPELPDPDVNYYRADPDIEGYLFDKRVTIDGLERMGNVPAYGAGRREDTREIDVYFHRAEEEQQHVLSVTARGSARVDGESFIAKNEGIPLPFLPRKIRKRRMVTIAEQGIRGLDIAGLVDFAGARILKVGRSEAHRHLVADNLAVFSKRMA
jgi:hypothetical protein